MAYRYTAYHDFFMGPHTEPMIVTQPWGNFGVELFFVISGYVIFMTVDRTPTPWGFFVSRFSRLWPAFITCAALTASATALLTSDLRLHSSIVDVIVSATMLQHFFWGPDVDPAYWSLAYEIAFYALLAAIWYGLKRFPRRIEVYCTTLLMIMLINCGCGMAVTLSTG
jgi:peptidoglycan/LPS O-acetylase OafA/YrhL